MPDESFGIFGVGKLSIKRLQRDRQPVRLGCVLSLGTGKSPVVRSESIDLDLPQGFRDLRKLFGVIPSIVHLGKVLVQQVGES